MNLGEIRQKYPQYNDLSDQELADSFYNRFYSDMDRGAFDRQIGLAQPEESPGILQRVDEGIRNIADAATFGYADRAAAYVNPRINRFLGITEDVPEYEEALQQERARTQAAPGYIKYPSQIAGGIGTALAAAPGVAALAGRAGLTSLPLMGQMAGVGAVEGALHGAGHAQPGEAFQEAVKGAAIGAPLGAASRVVTGGVTGLVNRLNSALRGKSGVGSRAARDLGRAIRRDEMTPGQMTAAARRMAADRPGTATLADVGGENVKGLVERVAQTPGAGRTQVVPALTSKQKAQALRVGKDLHSLLGTQRSAYEAIQDTIQRRTAAATPLYDNAFRAGDRQIWTPELERITGAPFVGKAAQQAMTNWRNNVIADGFGAMNPTVRGGAQGLIRVGGKGPPVFPNLQFWDYTKRALDDMAQTFKGKQGSKYRAVVRLTQQLRQELDNAVPEYAAARNAWSGPAAYMEAIEAGRDVFNKRMSSEEWRATFNALTDAEKEGFRIGVVNSIVGKMGNDPAKLGDMTKYLRSAEVKQKIAAIMPTEEMAETWLRRFDYEEQASELTGRALANSATARRLAEQDAAKEIVGDLVVDAILSGGSSPSLLRRVLGAGPKWFRDTVRSKADAQLADILTNPARLDDLDQILGRAAIRTTPTPPALAGAVASGTIAPLTPNPPPPPPDEQNRLPVSPIQFQPGLPEGPNIMPEAPRDQEMTPEVMRKLLEQFMERGWITPDGMRRLETEQNI